MVLGFLDPDLLKVSPWNHGYIIIKFNGLDFYIKIKNGSIFRIRVPLALPLCNITLQTSNYLSFVKRCPSV